MHEVFTSSPHGFTRKVYPARMKKSGIWNEKMTCRMGEGLFTVCPTMTSRIAMPFAISSQSKRFFTMESLSHPASVESELTVYGTTRRILGDRKKEDSDIVYNKSVFCNSHIIVVLFITLTERLLL